MARGIDFDSEIESNCGAARTSNRFDLLKKDFYANGNIISIEFAQKLFNKQVTESTKRQFGYDDEQEKGKLNTGAVFKSV